MSPFAIRAGAFLFGFSAVLLTGIPDAPPVLDRDDTPPSVQTRMTARERWESLTPDERQRVRQRFERLQQLDAGERAELEQRAQKRKRTEEKVLGQLSPRVLKRLMEAEPRHRRQLIDEMVEAELRHQGRRIEAKLPKEIREQLNAAPPAERRKRLTQFKRETRERISLVVVEDTARALGYEQQDIARFMKLPLDRRMKLVLELRKKFTAQQVAASGLPQGLTQEHWDELDRLPPRDYFAEVMRLREEGAFGAPPKTEQRSPRISAKAREIGRLISRGLRHDPQERLELSELPPHRRRTVLDQRRRDRVMVEVRKLEVFDAAQLERLEAMPDDEFFLHARRVAQDLRRGRIPDVRKWQPGKQRGERGRSEGRKNGERPKGERSEPGDQTSGGKAPGSSGDRQ